MAIRMADVIVVEYSTISHKQSRSLTLIRAMAVSMQRKMFYGLLFLCSVPAFLAIFLCLSFCVDSVNYG